MSIFVVVNPSAGGGRARRAWPAIAARLKAAVGPFDHAETCARGDATRLVREAVAQGAATVIAFGGDGTVNEALNGLPICGEQVRTGISFGMIPLGTGSDLARSIWTCTALDHVVDCIASGCTRRIDLGRVTFVDDAGNRTERLFANIASFGVSGSIDRAVNAAPQSRLVPRKALFLAATVRALAGYRFQAVRMRIDDQPAVETTIALAAVANGRYFGGGMMIAPDAGLDDAMFDVVTLRGASKLVLLRDLQMVFGGRHRNHPAISIQRGRKVTVEPVSALERVLLDIDGESPGRLPATFDILPAALDLRC